MCLCGSFGKLNDIFFCFIISGNASQNHILMKESLVYENLKLDRDSFQLRLFVGRRNRLC